MKIAVVVPEFPPYTIGGGGVVFEALVGELAERHDVRVYSACDPSRSWIRSLAPESTDSIRRFPLLPVGASKPHLRSVIPPNPFSAVQLVRDLRSWRPDVGHLHGYGYGFIDLAALVLRRLKVPYVLTNHGFPLSPYSRSAVTRLLYGCYQVVGAERTSSLSAATTYVSSAVANMEPAPPDHRSVVIENGVAPLPLPSRADCQSMRDRLRLGDSIVIGAAGRLSWSKGFDILIGSLEHLCHHEVTCVIAGADGGELSALAEQAAALPPHLRVLLPGPLNREDLGALFGLSNVVAVPSRDEPFGLVALEAMTMGTRVVAAATGGLPAFVEGPLGTLVPPNDPKSLAAALDLALDGPIRPLESGQRQSLLRERSWNTVAIEYERLLARIHGGATVP